MNTKTDPLTPRQSNALKIELHNVKNTSPFQRGEAALRLAAMTIVALDHLEQRIEALEEQTNAPQ